MRDVMEIKGTIAEFLEGFGIAIKNGIIDLGWENGWSFKKYDILHTLMVYEVKGTYSKSGSASSRKTTFTVNKDGEEYKVTYSTDSGD